MIARTPKYNHYLGWDKPYLISRNTITKISQNVNEENAYTFFTAIGQ